MSKQHRKKGHLPPFVSLIRTTLASPAWKQLSFGARSLYVVLRSYLRVDNLNNGKIFRPYREAAADLGTNSKTSVQRWFRELEHFGFIVQTRGAYLGVDGKGAAAHWRLTECSSFDAKGNHIAATRDFDRWNGELFIDPEKTKSRTQKRYSAYLQQVHTGDAKQGRNWSRRTYRRDIHSHASMSLQEGHNCLPLPNPTYSMCWATPRLIEVLDPAERAAIHAYWRPKTALAAFRAADHQPARRVRRRAGTP